MLIRCLRAAYATLGAPAPPEPCFRFRPSRIQCSPIVAADPRHGQWQGQQHNCLRGARMSGRSIRFLYWLVLAVAATAALLGVGARGACAQERREREPN